MVGEEHASGPCSGASLTALLTTLLKVRRGGLISGHDYQFQSQAMGRRATLRVPCERCHSKPAGWDAGPRAWALRRSSPPAVLSTMAACGAAGRRPVPQDVAHNEPLGTA